MVKRIVSYFFLFLLFSIILKIVFDQNKIIKKTKINSIPKCNELNYSESLQLHPNEFKKINLEIIISDNRRWKTLLLEEEILAKKNQIKFNSDYKFYETRKRVDARIVVGLDKQKKCFIKAKIRPHGDLADHRSENFLPSLNVNLVDGHIFGIVKFILFKPITRGYDNEVIATTLLNEINFLSPRTANVQVTYNDKSKKFIFQEKIVKEFIEINNQIENPVYRGDERFTFSDKQKYNIKRSVFNHQFKPINNQFISKGKNEKYLTEFGVSILNELVLYDQGDVDTDDLIDFVGAAENTIYKNSFKDFKIFDTILISMDATHAFTPGNRRIYFDTISKKFFPIYYDGQADLLDKDNKLKKKEYLEGKNISIIYKNPDIYYPGMFKGKVPKVSTSTAEEAHDLINEIDKKSFHLKLKTRGVKIKKETLDKYIDQILFNLNFLKNLQADKIIKTKKVDNNLIYIKNKKIFDNLFIKDNSINKANRLLVYNGKHNNEYLACNILSENCKNLKIDKSKIIDLISQKYKEKEKKFIFLGKNKKKDIFDGWFGNKEFNKFLQVKEYQFDNFKIKKFGGIDFTVDKNKKKIEIIKSKKSGKIVIFEGNMKDWEINFTDTLIIEKSKIIRRDSNGLTGCISLIDMEVANIKINTKDAKCEDSINFIRSNGSIDKINITNSSFDGLDGDFSKLYFKKINIKNSGNDCSDFSFGDYRIEDIDLINCGDKGISAGELSNINVNSLNSIKSKSVVASKDFAEVKINNFFSSNSEYCLQAYNKKQEFSGGLIQVKNFKCKEFSKKIEVDDKSNIEILKSNNL